MTRERFQRASDAFLAARSHAGAARQAILDHHCGDDAELRAEVERLLAGDGASSDSCVMDSGVIGAALRDAAAGVLREQESASGDTARDPYVNKRIGRYLVLDRIGSGGMGAVYRAEQDNPRRIVALKIIRPGLVSPTMLRRFQHEAHVLGRLQHPGIAQIFEAGTHDLGDGAQPYFVMEFVDGFTLNAYARDAALDRRARLELLAGVADAVEHAHQRGVIHRDLKPGNILVTRGIDATKHSGVEARDLAMTRSLSASNAQPKILDFGVARAIDSDVNATTLHTTPGQIVGTVAYMSPEQAAGKPDDIDTRSDVYALGVIGYELLAGRPPHDLERRTVPDALRTIAETDPTMLGSVDRACRGDVETIIARALEKDRSRRYQSAAEFAADIRRYLRDEPILARPPSAIYQLRKFARRNKALVGGMTAVLIVLVAGVVGTSIGLSRALDEARKARRMNEYLKGMISFLDPSVTKNNQVTLRDVLDDASRRVDAELAGEPDVASELLVTIAGGYRNINAYDEAARHGERAIDLMAGLRDPDDPAFAAVWELVGMSYFRGNRPAEAERAYRAALALNRRLLGDDHPDTLGNIRDIIHLLEIQGKPADTDELVAIARHAAMVLPERSEEENVGLSYEAIGDILGTQHRLEDAERMYLKAIDVLQRVQNSPYAAEQCIVTMRNLAFIYEMQSRVAEAEDLDRRAVHMSLERFGPEHDVTIVSLQGWIRMLRGSGRAEQAEEQSRRLLSIMSKLYGENGNEYAHTLHNLAMLVRERGRPQEAIPMFEQALAIRRGNADADVMDIARTLSGLGMALVDVNRGAEAVPILEEANAIRIRNLGEAHSSVPGMRTVTGAALVQAGEYSRAEQELLAALPLLGAQPAMRRDGLAWLVKLYEAQNRHDDAARYRVLLAQTTQPQADDAGAP